MKSVEAAADLLGRYAAARRDAGETAGRDAQPHRGVTRDLLPIESHDSAGGVTRIRLVDGRSVRYQEGDPPELTTPRQAALPRPDGKRHKRQLFIRDHNLWLRKRASGPSSGDRARL